MNSESAAQVNAGNVVFQDGVGFLGDDPWTPGRPHPTSLYIGHGNFDIILDHLSRIFLSSTAPCTCRV